MTTEKNGPKSKLFLMDIYEDLRIGHIG